MVVKFFHLDNKQFEVKVPKNTAPDSRLKLQGKGMPNPQGRGIGDLFVIVDVTTPNLTDKQLQKLSEFIGKSASKLQMELGKPDEDFKNAKGNFEYVYNTKKYLIPCERRFEINSENIVIGFVSNGCF